MRTGAENTRLSLAECRKILCTDGVFYTDEEIIEIRNFLYHMADIAIDALESEKPAAPPKPEVTTFLKEEEKINNHEKKSDHLHPCINR